LAEKFSGGPTEKNYRKIAKRPKIALLSYFQEGQGKQYRNFQGGPTEKIPENSIKTKNSTIKLFPGGGVGNEKKTEKQKKSSIKHRSIYYVCIMYENPGEARPAAESMLLCLLDEATWQTNEQNCKLQNFFIKS